MTIRSTILAALQKSDGLCDDCLSEVTATLPRQSINTCCRDLHVSMLLGRPRETCPRCGRIKLVNRLSTSTTQPGTATSVVITIPESNGSSNHRPWYWEGNVQEKIIHFLKSLDCTVHSSSDTATRQQGKDIVAVERDGRTLWVTVKGFPEKSKNVQARHWFAGALLDLARYKDENANASLAMGLPHGFSTYEGLIRRTDAVRKFLGYSVYWVRSDGTVICDEPIQVIAR